MPWQPSRILVPSEHKLSLLLPYTTLLLHRSKTMTRDSVDEMPSVLVRAFHQCDKELLESCDFEDGCTATTVLIMGKRMWAANLGDSRVIMSR